MVRVRRSTEFFRIRHDRARVELAGAFNQPLVSGRGDISNLNLAFEMAAAYADDSPRQRTTLPRLRVTIAR